MLELPARPPAVLDVLTHLVIDIRQALIHPELGTAAKLARVSEIVDAAEPPPLHGLPGGSPGGGHGAGEGLLAATHSPAPSAS